MLNEGFNVPAVGKTAVLKTNRFDDPCTPRSLATIELPSRPILQVPTG
jgi:hypothetical protein